MPFGVVTGISRGMGVLDGSGDRRRGRDSFGGDFGIPIATNGPLLRSCVEVSFGVVSGVGPGIDVLDGAPHASRGRADSGI